MAKRRVLIDGYFLGRPFGFGRFIKEMCRALGRAQTDLEFIVAVPDDVDATLLATYPNLSWHRTHKPNFIVWEQLVIPRLARQLGCDIIHFPYNTKARFTRGLPSITTVHDIMFLDDAAPVRQLKAFLSATYIKYAFTQFTRRSEAIISVSETTRAVLAARGIDSRTIYNTVDGFLSTYAHKIGHNDGARYMLHRGGFSEHRNTERVIEAFRLSRPILQDVSLKILGAPGGAGHWNTKAEPDIQFLDRVSDEEMASLYAGSSCVIVTSLVEGFGLPIIEAFGFEAPVITSNIDPMMEIAGDAALMVDPRSVEAISRGMIAVLSDPALAAALVEKGRTRLKAFASENIAQQLVAVYEHPGRR